jgi:acyl-CoA synthetase (AMP-forming)/AMP-acid ligase II/peptidoglycan/LPS O-acetylase OafA/YrhL
MTFEDRSRLLDRVFQTPGHRTAAIDATGPLSYSELLARANAIAEQLGRTPRLVILECAPSIAWLTCYVALQLGGHVALLVPPGAPATRSRLVNSFNAHVELRLDQNYRVEVQHSDPLEMHPDLSILLSTSGSTGSPKSVRLSHQNLASNAASIAEYLQISENDRGVVNLPTHYSYGLSIVNSHLWTGATILFTDSSVTDPAFWAFCRQHGATSFAGVPHTYDLLSRVDFETLAPPSLRYFTQAGGRLRRERAEALAHLAARHGWRFYIMYGQTEASPRMAYLPPDKLLYAPGSIGIAIPGGRLSVQDEAGQALPPEAEGELVYEGPNVMMGYAMSAADLGQGQGPSILRTGDMARKGVDGLFYITGRMSRFIKIFGNRIGLDEVEAICGMAGHVTVATGIDDKLLVITRQIGTESEIGALLSTVLKLPPHTIEVRQMEDFPVLPTGKIDYARLKASLQNEDPTASVTPASVPDIYRHVFGDRARDDSLSFTDLGGDSLTFVHVSMELEAALGKLPDTWPDMPAKELDGLAAGQPPARPASSQPYRRLVLGKADTLRAVACLLVVMLHVFGADPESGLQFPADSAWRLPFEVLDLLRMPLFTALAGLLYGALPSSRPGLSSFLKQRTLALVLPAVVVSVIYFTIRSVMDKEQGSLLSALLSGYLHLWYLYALFVIVACVGTIDALCRPRTETWLLIVAGLYLLCPLVPWIGLFSITHAMTLAPYFILGLMLYRRPSVLGHAPLIYAAAIVAVGGLILRFATATGEMRLTPVEGLLIYPFASMALILLAARFFPRIPRLEWLGLYSYAIYLWHPLGNAAVRSVGHYLGVTQPAVLFCLGTIAGVIIPIGLFLLAERLPHLARHALVGR